MPNPTERRPARTGAPGPGRGAGSLPSFEPGRQNRRPRQRDQRGERPRAADAAMAENSNVIVRQVPRWMTETPRVEKAAVDVAELQTRLAALERRHDKTRKFVVEGLSFAITVAICVAFVPN